MPDDPLAYFITMHTYGTWLHGAAEGSVDWAHHDYGEPFAVPNADKKAAMRRRMQGQPLTLTSPQRSAVQESCLETCRYREWRLHALHVRTTHVHAVLTAAVDPEQVMNDLKTYATRRLRRLQVIASDAKVWSRHGSTRYLWQDDAVRERVGYVLNDQGVALDPPPFVSDEFRNLQRPPGDAPPEPRP